MRRKEGFSSEIEHSQYFSFSFLERQSNFEDFTTSVNGRIVKKRGVFYDILIDGNILQIFIDKEIRNSASQYLKVGNFVRLDGVFTTSKTGQVTLAVHNYYLLSEAQESIKRNPDNNSLSQFVQSLSSQPIREKLVIANKIPDSIHSYLGSQEFNNVRTSSLHSVDTGLKSAGFKVGNGKMELRRDFDLETRAYLLFLEKIYQIGYVFRNEGVSKKNRNEFLYGNLYQAFIELPELVTLVIELFENLVGEFKSGEDDQEDELQVVNFKDFIYGSAGVSSDDEFMEMASKTLQINFEGDLQRAQHEYYRKKAKKETQSPILIEGYPSKYVPFAQAEDTGSMGKDFRLLWNGRTVFHGSQEINDPKEQIEKWRSIHGDDYGTLITEGERRYLELLLYGLPPYCGVSISVDLLIQLLINIENVNELRPTIV